MTRRPNIVYVLADDLGYGDYGAFNEGRSNTPTLDGLIGESICLTQHYAASCVCNPSRAAILTGRYPHRTGSIDTLEWRGLERLALRETTLAEVLAGAGYTTGLIGKWHLGAFDPRYHPMRRGFHESVCFRGGMHDYYKWRIEYGEDKIERGDGRYLTDLWSAEAADFIDRHAADPEPFFLHVTYNAPHGPFQVPEDEVRPFLEDERFNTGVSILYGMIHRMDTGVAQILGALERNGIADNTVFIFTSDNGPQFGCSDDPDKKLDRFNCEFHGAKGLVYEGGIRVPFMVRWPDGLEGGRTDDLVAHHTDWFPTLLAMAGVDYDSPRKLDGANLLPALRGEEGEVPSTRCWQWNRYTPLVESNAAIRDGDWKLVRPEIAEAVDTPDMRWLDVSMYEPEFFVEGGVFEGEPPRQVPPPPKPELYNIADDPLERRNLAEERPELASRLLTKLENWFEEVEAERRTIDDDWLVQVEPAQR